MKSSSAGVSFPSPLLLVLSAILRKKTHAHSQIFAHLKHLKSLLSFRVPQIVFNLVRMKTRILIELEPLCETYGGPVSQRYISSQRYIPNNVTLKNDRNYLHFMTRASLRPGPSKKMSTCCCNHSKHGIVLNDSLK